MRRDVRAVRARLLLLLLSARCPIDSIPARRWYVPGAAVRLGAQGLARLWAERFHDVPAPCERRVRDHLLELERALLLVRQPGEWIPQLTDPEHPERRHRWPDSFHLLEREEDAEWWQVEGVRILEQHPDARTNPTAWKAHLGAWRERRRHVQRPLFADAAAELAHALRADRPGKRDAQVAALTELRRAETLREAVVGEHAVGAALLDRLELAGCALRGSNRAQVLRDPERLRGAAALLALALRRGRVVRNRPGFLVAAWRRAPGEEMARARELLATG